MNANQRGTKRSTSDSYDDRTGPGGIGPGKRVRIGAQDPEPDELEEDLSLPSGRVGVRLDGYEEDSVGPIAPKTLVLF